RRVLLTPRLAGRPLLALPLAARRPASQRCENSLGRCVPGVGEAHGERRLSTPVEFVRCPRGVDDAAPQITWSLGREAWLLLDARRLGAQAVQLADRRRAPATDVVDASRRRTSCREHRRRDIADVNEVAGLLSVPEDLGFLSRTHPVEEDRDNAAL